MSARIDTTTLEFLADIRDNNNRAWFGENKERYRAAAANYYKFVQELIADISTFDASLGTTTPESCIFRFYRDIRFSPNKTPYKVHLGAYIAPGGRKSPFAGYYLHIEPGASLLAGGVFMPATPTLQSIREDISFYENDFINIVEDRSIKNNFDYTWSNSLKKLPAGFTPGSRVDEFLKMRNIVPVKQLHDNDITSQNLMLHVLELCRAILPLNNFLNRAIKEQQNA